ncbi:MAG: hypothetical protein ACI87E_005315, partial [Mariniblastus sp.]
SIVLSACQAIRVIAGRCDYEAWQTAVSRILGMAESAEATAESAPIVYQQLAIEAPLVLAFQIPELENQAEIISTSCSRMARSIGQMLDHDGWPHARYLQDFGAVVASWARCNAVINELATEQGLEFASQLEWVVRQILRMLRPDRTLVFSGSSQCKATDEFLACLLEMSIDSDDKRLLKTVLAEANGKPVSSRVAAIEPSNLSEWSESAILQSRWASNSPKLAVDYSNGECWTELARDIDLIRGNTAPQVTINGVAMATDEPFEVACIESDDDVEYLELERELGKGVKLTRQFLLSRSEEFLLAADLIVCDTASRIDYRSSWPLADKVEGMHESETRELYLTSKKIHSLVLPLALPEWKTGRSDDSLKFDDQAMTLVQSTDGLGLYAPLFFDLNPKRSKKKRTWRQLTVGERLEIVHRDEACAFRVQLDKFQWIFYRAISSVGNRTFIGENVSSEFAFSRFESDGTVTSLIEI